MTRSLKEGRGAAAELWRGGAYICGTTGTSILGGGGGGGSGGLRGEVPGGIICAEAALAKMNAAAAAPMMIDECFIGDK